jgi:hypothetical protein
MSETLVSTDHAACLPQDCTGVSSLLDEPLLGSAPHAHAWLLIVLPGPWPSSAPHGLLDPVVTDELERRCDYERVRMVAVRRTGQPRRGPLTCYVASSRPDRTWLERVELTEPKALLDLDIAAIGQGSPPADGERLDGPLYAVCTHGKRDACCAAHGRPVQRALSAAAPGRVWEATHLGGHRFAANVLVLPEGLLYGRVDAGNAQRLARTHARGDITPSLWRGRSAYPQAAQAAEWFVRQRTGLTAVDDIAIDAIEGGAQRWSVHLRAGGQPVHAQVERTRTGCARITGCTGTVADPGRWQLLSLS